MDKKTVTQEWVQQYQEAIKPNRRTIEQLEEYLLNHYQAKKISLTPEQILQTEQNVILKHYTDAAHQPVKMDIIGFEIPFYQEQTYIGHFIVILDRVTEEIYTLNFNNKTNQTPNLVQIKNIIKDILLYLGVSELDIQKKNHRFLQYLTTLIYYSQQAEENTVIKK